MKPPCYDTKNKKDCEKRHIGCYSTCKLWQNYLIERQKTYDERLTAFRERPVFIHHNQI